MATNQLVSWENHPSIGRFKVSIPEFRREGAQTHNGSHYGCRGLWLFASVVLGPYCLCNQSRECAPSSSIHPMIQHDFHRFQEVFKFFNHPTRKKRLLSQDAGKMPSLWQASDYIFARSLFDPPDLGSTFTSSSTMWHDGFSIIFLSPSYFGPRLLPRVAKIAKESSENDVWALQIKMFPSHLFWLRLRS